MLNIMIIAAAAAETENQYKNPDKPLTTQHSFPL
jgi:hypothetical protein